MEELIQSLVGRSESRRESRGGSPAARGSRPSSFLGSGLATDPAETSPNAPGRASTTATASTATQTLADAETVATSEAPVPAKREVVTYSVGVQTSEEWTPPSPEDGRNGQTPGA